MRNCNASPQVRAFPNRPSIDEGKWITRQPQFYRYLANAQFTGDSNSRVVDSNEPMRCLNSINSRAIPPISHPLAKLRASSPSTSGGLREADIRWINPSEASCELICG